MNRPRSLAIGCIAASDSKDHDTLIVDYGSREHIRSVCLAKMHLAAIGTNLPVEVPLAVACLSVMVGIPVTAARGKLHVPGYVGLAFLAFALGLLFGRISGTRTVTGTLAGLSLSILFFLLMATVVGCVLALFFYRHPPEA